MRSPVPRRRTLVPVLLLLLLTALVNVYLRPTAVSVEVEEDGWGTVHVFYANRDALPMPQNQTYFAHGRQDEIVLSLLGDSSTKRPKPRYFIDLAANDAVKISNTLALERHNWKGLCIEPNKDYWYGLVVHRKCTVVAAFVGGNTPQKVQVRFRNVFGGIVDTLDSNREAKLQRKQPIPEETRYTVPIQDILTRFQVPHIIDYLSLDVEGAEYFVLQHFPFQDYKIRFMTVENPTDEIKALLQKHDYVFLKKLIYYDDTLWAHKSMGLTPTHPKIASIQTIQKYH